MIQKKLALLSLLTTTLLFNVITHSATKPEVLNVIQKLKVKTIPDDFARYEACFNATLNRIEEAIRNNQLSLSSLVLALHELQTIDGAFTGESKKANQIIWGNSALSVYFTGIKKLGWKKDVDITIIEPNIAGRRIKRKQGTLPEEQETVGEKATTTLHKDEEQALVQEKPELFPPCTLPKEPTTAYPTAPAPSERFMPPSANTTQLTITGTQGVIELLEKLRDLQSTQETFVKRHWRDAKLEATACQIITDLYALQKAAPAQGRSYIPLFLEKAGYDNEQLEALELLFACPRSS